MLTTDNYESLGIGNPLQHKPEYVDMLQQEIDYLEVEKEEVFAFEIKWNPKKNVKPSKTFVDTYGQNFEVINSDNFRDFLV